jgi:catechol 2,3-dioxygenase
MTPAPHATLTIGKVTLTVHDLEGVTAFYENVLGLHLIAKDSISASLGVGLTILLELRQDRAARRHSPRDAGLFHTAFLLPSRADLGRWTQRATKTRLPIQGASDHLVSEAIYLADPEGNGVEIYADRPRSAWKWERGTIAMATEPLDMQDLLDSAGGESWQGFPDGGTVGHVHLQVGALAAAEEFYKTRLGFDITCHYPGATFFSTGGYHHHLATNIWNSRGASGRPQRTTGLADVEIIAESAPIMDALRSRFAGVPLSSDAPTRVSVRDPWGTSITITERTADHDVMQTSRAAQ